MHDTQLTFMECSKPKSSYSYPPCTPIIRSIQCNQCGFIHDIRVGCGCRLCPVCSQIYAKRQWLKYIPQIKSYKRPALLTLTTIRQEKLNYSEIRKHFRAFRHYYSNINIEGGLYVFETKQKSDGWHTHIHAIIDSKYYPQEKISEEWKAATGDSFVVDIRRVTKRKALGYVLFYVNKKTELLNESGAIEFLTQSKNTHLIQTFGNRNGVRVEKLHFPCPRCGSVDWNFNIDVHFSECENETKYGVG